jgi:hypothetical protein
MVVAGTPLFLNTSAALAVKVAYATEIAWLFIFKMLGNFAINVVFPVPAKPAIDKLGFLHIEYHQSYIIPNAFFWSFVH